MSAQYQIAVYASVQIVVHIAIQAIISLQINVIQGVGTIISEDRKNVMMEIQTVMMAVHQLARLKIVVKAADVMAGCYLG